MARIKLLKRLAVPTYITIRGQQQLKRFESVDAFSETDLSKHGYLTDDGRLNTDKVYDECDVITGEAEHADEVREVEQTLAEFASAVGFEGTVQDTTDKLDNPGFANFSVGKNKGATSGKAKDLLKLLG